MNVVKTIGVRINGSERQVPERLSVAELLHYLNIIPEQVPPKPLGIAVAINREVLPRSEHDKRFVQPRDQIEIIHAVGGG